jgi:hypothetical membrane protein
VASAALSPLVLTAAWVIAGLLQPHTYSPVQQSISVLAGYAGAHRWIVTGALLVAGALHAVTAAGLGGLHSRARISLLVAGAAAIGVAVCPEPSHGSTPQHLAFTVFGVIAISVWPAMVGARRYHWSRVLSVRGSLMVTAVFLAMLAWLTVETHIGGLLGVAERVVVSVQACWPFVVAVAAWRARHRLAAALPSSSRSTVAMGTPGR